MSKMVHFLGVVCPARYNPNRAVRFWLSCIAIVGAAASLRVGGRATNLRVKPSVIDWLSGEDLIKTYAVPGAEWFLNGF